MYYPKSKDKELSDELFKYPTSEYRATPFWAWNCKLEPKELCRQIEIFKKMGFGGFYMHSRDGLDTAYLGDEFMEAVKRCADTFADEIRQRRCIPSMEHNNGREIQRRIRL